jgi:hypothetical protein
MQTMGATSLTQLSHLLQMAYHRHVRIHVPINTILHAGFFAAVELAGGDLGGDASVVQLANRACKAQSLKPHFRKHMSVSEWTVDCICAFWPAHVVSDIMYLLP